MIDQLIFPEILNTLFKTHEGNGLTALESISQSITKINETIVAFNALETANTAYKIGLTADNTSYKNGLTADNTAYKNELNQLETVFQGQMTTLMNNMVTYAEGTGLTNAVASKFATWLNDGTWKGMIDNQVVNDINVKINRVANGAPKAVSLISLMTDTTKNYVYTGSEDGYVHGNWYYYNGSAWVSGDVYNSTGISDGDVSIRKTAFIVQNKSENLFDKLRSNLPQGYYINGVFTANANSLVTHPIKIDRGIVYSFKADYTGMLSNAGEYYYCDETGTNKSEHYDAVISGDHSYCTFTTLENPPYDYVITNIGTKTFIDTYMFVEGNTYPTEYIPYHYESYLYPNIGLNKVQKAEIGNYKNAEYIDKAESVNLFNKDDTRVVKGFYVNGVFTSVNTDFVTHPMRVYKGKTYIFLMDNTEFNGNGGHIEYFYTDKNGNLLSTYKHGTAMDSNTHCLFTVPSDCEYDYVITNIGTHLDTYMFVEASVYPESYAAFTYKTLSNDFKLNATQIKQTQLLMGDILTGKIAAFDGDSIGTASADAQDGYAGRIVANNSMIYTNYADNGATIAFTGVERHCISRTVLRADADYVIFEGGTNDADLLGVSNIGTISVGFDAVLDDTNFSGAVEKMLKTNIIKYPGKKLGFIIAHKMGSVAEQATRKTFFDRIMEICRKWGVPYLNIWETSHLNPLIPAIAALYYSDTQHLTTAGYDFITPSIESWLKTL